MLRWSWLAVLVSACAPKPPPDPPPPDSSSRARTYVAGDPSAKLERMRQNADAIGCKVEERTSGTLFACGDVQIWVVPDSNGMEVTCTGLPINCGKRGRELLREDDAGVSEGP